MRARGITGVIRHGSGAAGHTFAVGIMTVGTDGVMPTVALVTPVVIMGAAMRAPTADSMAGRLSTDASTTAVAVSTVVEATAADAGKKGAIKMREEWPAGNCRPFSF